MAEIYPFLALLPETSFAEAQLLKDDFKKRLKEEQDTFYLKELLDHGAFARDDTPCLYVYQQEQNGETQTGIWAQVIPGAIKIHEQLLPEKIERIHEFRLRTGLEPKPVLLTYPPIAAIRKLIAAIVDSARLITYTDGHQTHRFWRVTDPSAYQKAFESLDAFYMADGHHRLAANPFETLSALLMDTTEIKVKSYNRIVQTTLDLADYFFIEESKYTVFPTGKHHFGLLRDDRWYALTAKKTQQYDTEILAKLFDHIEYTPGTAGAPGKLLFTLYPLKIEEVMAAADAGAILPPKSTWIEPKIPYGLLMCGHQPY